MYNRQHTKQRRKDEMTQPTQTLKVENCYTCPCMSNWNCKLASGMDVTAQAMLFSVHDDCPLKHITVVLELVEDNTL